MKIIWILLILILVPFSLYVILASPMIIFPEGYIYHFDDFNDGLLQHAGSSWSCGYRCNPSTFQESQDFLMFSTYDSAFANSADVRIYDMVPILDLSSYEQVCVDYTTFPAVTDLQIKLYDFSSWCSITTLASPGCFDIAPGCTFSHVSKLMLSFNYPYNTGVYSINISYLYFVDEEGVSTCSDGILNGDENGVDCSDFSLPGTHSCVTACPLENTVPIEEDSFLETSENSDSLKYSPEIVEQPYLRALFYRFLSMFYLDDLFNWIINLLKGVF